jgi:hypothetical protein
MPNGRLQRVVGELENMQGGTMKAKQRDTRIADLKTQVRILEQERGREYAEGSAKMLASVYAALGTLELNLWLSQKLLGARTRRPPFNLPPEIEADVRAEVAECLRRCGNKNVDVRDIEL